MISCGYGAYPPSEDGGLAYEEFAREIRMVESAGLDAAFFPEHHAMPGFFPSPLAGALFYLGMTTRLRIGTGPMLLPLHNPVRVAEDAALADRASGGRLILGLGAGYLATDFDQIGLSVSERGARFEEGLQTLLAAWAEDRPHLHGKFYRLKQEGPLVPKPLQQPHPPLWLAAATQAGLRRAARYGDALLVDSMRHPDEVRSMASRYRDLCAEYGRDARVVLMRRAWVGEAAETEAFASRFAAELEGYLKWSSGPWTKSLREAGLTRETIRQRIVVGDVTGVADALAELSANLGVDYFILKLRWQGAADSTALYRAIERAGEVAAMLARG